MGKLKSTVAYVQFEEAASARGAWPVLDRASRLQRRDAFDATPAVSTPTVTLSPRSVTLAPKAASNATGSLLRRYGAAPQSAASVETSRRLTDIFSWLEG
jgi:hypothetical protein